MGKPNWVIDKEQKKVFWDGEFLGNVIGDLDSQKGDYELELDFHNLNILVNYRIDEILKKDFYFLLVELKKDFLAYSDWLMKIDLYFGRNESQFIYLDIDIQEWDQPFTFKTFFEKLKSNLEFDQIISVESEDVITALADSLMLRIKIIDKNKNIKDLCDSILMTLKSRLNLVIMELILKQDSLTNTFTFPPEIQSSCEQYLIYFATFLKDIGINAETNIESKTHETLFTVIPANGEEALDKIKEALQVYLSLPESPEFETVASEFTDVGVQQLASQVYFLKSQLALGKTMIQMKDATIEALQLTNYQQKEIIQSHQTKEKNEEELAGGLVKANEVKVIGFTFDLPELLRRIKRKFKM